MVAPIVVGALTCLLALPIAPSVLLPAPPPPPPPLTVEQLIVRAAQRYGVNPAWLLRVARCESTLQPGVTSRGGHQGLFQFAPGTWRWMSAQAGWAGASPYDPQAAAEVAAWAFSRGYASHWSCK